MAFTIDKFRNNALAKGGARANLFDVTIAGAAATGQITGLRPKNLPLHVKLQQFQHMAVGVVEVPYFGRVVKVPGNKTFDNWTVTIINDEGLKLEMVWKNG